MSRFLVYLSVSTILCSVACADEIHIRGGGVINGKVTVEPESKEDKFYIIETDQGITLKISRTKIERVRKPSATQLQYAKLLASTDDTVEDHLIMAKWCLENRLSKERQYHQLCVLRLDPDHKEVRHQLGYAQRRDTRWLKREHMYKEQDYVQKGSTWVPREWQAIQEANAEYRKIRGHWLSEVSKWRKWITRGKSDLAIAELNRLKDPMASEAIADAFLKETDQTLRKIYIEVLARLDTNTARRALIITAMADKSISIREACLTELKRQNSPLLRANFVRGLDPKSNPNNAHINNAAIALGWLDAQEAIPQLIDALETEHVTANPNARGPGSISANNNGGFSVGGNQPKEIKRLVENRAVLQTLKELTGQDFQFDSEAWLNWYSQSRTPVVFDLRRNN